MFPKNWSWDHFLQIVLYDSHLDNLNNCELILVVSSQAQASIDLIGKNYYLFIARGPTSGTSLMEHDQEVSTPNALNFTIVGPNIEGEENHAGVKVFHFYL